MLSDVRLGLPPAPPATQRPPLRHHPRADDGRPRRERPQRRLTWPRDQHRRLPDPTDVDRRCLHPRLRRDPAPARCTGRPVGPQEGAPGRPADLWFNGGGARRDTFGCSTLQKRAPITAGTRQLARSAARPGHQIHHRAAVCPVQLCFVDLRRRGLAGFQRRGARQHRKVTARIEGSSRQDCCATATSRTPRRSPPFLPST